jgi:hypothetical protein
MAAKQVPVPISQPWVKYTHWIQTPKKVIQEVHWNSSSSNVQVGSQTYQQAANIFSLRQQCLPSSCSMLKWQISQENIWRDAVGTAPDPSNANGFIANNENLGNDCLNVLYFATPQYRRVAYLAAIPDRSITRDGWVPGAPTPFFTAVSNYLNALAGGPIGGPPSFPLPPQQTAWGYLPIAYGADTPAAVPIGNINIVATQPLLTVVTLTAHGLTAGQVARISKMPGANVNWPVNQRFLVNAVTDALTVVLQAVTPFSSSVTLDSPGGLIQQQFRIFEPYSYYSIDQPGTRKRGNTQLSPKGRNKVKYNIGYPG